MKTNTATKTKFKRQTVYVTTERDKPRTTRVDDALVLGDLAVHRGLLSTTLEPIGNWYVITHIPSGLQLADGCRLRNCRRLVEQLDALGIDWNFQAHFPSDDFINKAKPLIREFISNPRN